MCSVCDKKPSKKLSELIELKMGVVKTPANALVSNGPPPSPEDTFQEDMAIEEFMWRSCGNRLGITKDVIEKHAQTLKETCSVKTIGELKHKITREVFLKNYNF